MDDDSFQIVARHIIDSDEEIVEQWNIVSAQLGEVCRVYVRSKEGMCDVAT